MLSSLLVYSFSECNLELDLNSGIVIAVPMPESHAPLGTQIEAAIQQALQDAKYEQYCDLQVKPAVHYASSRMGVTFWCM